MSTDATSEIRTTAETVKRRRVAGSFMVLASLALWPSALQWEPFRLPMLALPLRLNEARTAQPAGGAGGGVGVARLSPRAMSLRLGPPEAFSPSSMSPGTPGIPGAPIATRASGVAMVPLSQLIDADL